MFLEIQSADFGVAFQGLSFNPLSLYFCAKIKKYKFYKEIEEVVVHEQYYRDPDGNRSRVYRNDIAVVRQCLSSMI